MKITRLIEQIYKNKRDINSQLAKKVTLPNSLQYLSLCADFFQRKQKDTSATLAVKMACKRLTDDGYRVLKSYHNYLDDLTRRGLAVNKGTYYSISLSTDFDQIIYMPKEDQDFIKYRFENVITILTAVDKVVNNPNIDTVIADNDAYMDFVHDLAVFRRRAQAEFEKIDPKFL